MGSNRLRRASVAFLTVIIRHLRPDLILILCSFRLQRPEFHNKSNSLLLQSSKDLAVPRLRWRCSLLPEGPRSVVRMPQEPAGRGGSPGLRSRGVPPWSALAGPLESHSRRSERLSESAFPPRRDAPRKARHHRNTGWHGTGSHTYT